MASVPLLLAAGPGACGREPTPGTVTVTGRVVGVDGRPIPGARVLVVGRAPTAADSDGAFTVHGVEPPYDVAAVAPGAAEVTVYLGVSRPDPTVALAALGDPLHSARVGGQVAGGGPLPASGRIRTRVAFGGRALVAEADADRATGAYDLTVGWNDGAEASGELRALRWEHDAAGLPISYLGHAQDGLLSLGEGDALSRQLVLQPLETGSLTGRVEAPWPVSMKSLAVVLGDGPGMSLADDGSESADFDYAVPALAGTTVRVWACAFGPAGGYVAGQVAVVAPVSTGVQLLLPPPPALLEPGDGAAEVDGTTRFAWTRFSGLHAVHVRGPAGAPAYAVLTGQAETRLPDLSPLGVAPPPDAVYGWQVFGTTLFSDIDDFAHAPVIGDIGVGFAQALSAGRTFTTAPRGTAP